LSVAYCVLGEDLDQIDQDVLRSHARISGQVVDDLAIECLFLFDRAGVVGADLDHDQIVAAADPEIAPAVAEIGFVVLGNHHKAILVRHIEGGTHRAIDALEDGLTVNGGFASAKPNANKRHVELLFS